jgi:hypothetical protein
MILAGRINLDMPTSFHSTRDSNAAWLPTFELSTILFIPTKICFQSRQDQDHELTNHELANVVINKDSISFIKVRIIC